MYIVSQDGKQIVNAEYPERFCLAEKPDAVLVVASYRDDRPPVTLGRYANLQEAAEVLWTLLVALTGGQGYMSMPPSLLNAAAPVVHDARTKRRGGS